jgi:hypothetical protein
VLDQTPWPFRLSTITGYHCDRLHERAPGRVTSFYTMIMLTLVYTGGLYLWAKRRVPGQPMTWGEAFVGAFFIFGYFVLIYGLLPNAWLQWCDGSLKWRSDKIGIPLGPLHHELIAPVFFGLHPFTWNLNLLKNDRRYFGFLPVNKGLLWPTGITFFGRGKLAFNAQSCRDIGAVIIYSVMIGVQFKGWLWWQKRGEGKVAAPELPTSAYGRPLVRKA